MNKLFVSITILILLMQSCVDRYFLNEYVKFVPRIVVDAFLDDLIPIQEIKISLSSNPDMPNKKPLSDCIVIVKDKFGNAFEFKEVPNNLGNYKSAVDLNVWKVGAHFQLYLETPDGDIYTTKFQEIKPCPEIDSVYYVIERKPTSDPDITEDGLQFYLNLVANETYDRYYKWVLEETWEYHSSFVKKMYNDASGVFHNGPVDSSNFICYKTRYVSDLFTVSTKGFIQNKYERYKLHFVNDHTQKLLYRYSILVKQYSINEEEYLYWKNIKENDQQSGGVYSKQPAQVEGNIFNLSDSTDKVLGYFSISSIKTKRIKVRGVKELSFENVPYCTGILDGQDTPPTYFINMSNGKGGYILAFVNDECVICTLLGGTTEVPDFWK